MLARALPKPTMLARTMPDASMLTPQATIPTVLVPVMPESAPTTAVPGLAIPAEGAETTVRPAAGRLMRPRFERNP
jgi:hypothetical protein